MPSGNKHVINTGHISNENAQLNVAHSHFNIYFRFICEWETQINFTHLANGRWFKLFDSFSVSRLWRLVSCAASKRIEITGELLDKSDPTSTVWMCVCVCVWMVKVRQRLHVISPHLNVCLALRWPQNMVFVYEPLAFLQIKDDRINERPK